MVHVAVISNGVSYLKRYAVKNLGDYKMSDGMKDMIMFVAWSTIIIEVACIGFMLANYFRLDTVI